MVRGLERRAIFQDDRDRNGFLERLATLASAGAIEVYTWALLPNHAHVLLRTGTRPLARTMRSLLTGYAGAFNRRHRRVGHLFQNRYKSILVEEDPYLLELVRYLNLNPLRAGIVPDLAALDRYPWSGHSALLGRVMRPWQAVDFILGQFGATPAAARRHYRQFMAAGVAQGKRPDLQGGGLRRSAGGWAQVALLRRARERWAADERILGSGAFVEHVLLEMTPAPPPGVQPVTAVPLLVTECARAWGVSPEEVRGASRRRAAAHARAAVSALAVRHLGLSAAAVARTLGVTPAVVLRGVERGPQLLETRGLDPGPLVRRVRRKV
jgi:REP element-mobilizing transposase RayT